MISVIIYGREPRSTVYMTGCSDRPNNCTNMIYYSGPGKNAIKKETPVKLHLTGVLYFVFRDPADLLLLCVDMTRETAEPGPEL